ncbi:MAG: AAA family ATPase, partial [Tidjanibacter sp.]|nr:AAA family ATPase [Tidjanibacter sp.]
MTTTSTKPTLVVIVGPTGSGKTAVSIELARRLGAPIISTDSRQMYQGMAIGTAQPTPEELAAATHYFIADRPITSPLSAGAYEREALALLKEPKSADLLIINTCSIRQLSQDKAYSYLGLWGKWKKTRPNLKIGICGCVA